MIAKCMSKAYNKSIDGRTKVWENSYKKEAIMMSKKEWDEVTV